MEYAIAVILALVGLAIFVAIVSLGRMFMRGITRAAEVPPERPSFDDVEVSGGPVGVDELVYLYAHEFTRPRTAVGPALPRDRFYSPLNDAELDADELTNQLLYVALCELHRGEYIDFRAVERPPTYLPPFPQKKWELQLRRLRRLPDCPICGALGVGFDLARKRLVAKQQPVDEKALWVSLDELVERALKSIRQELNFWERTGVHGDLRNYVASSLIARGYLIAAQKDTWLDKVRTKRPAANTRAIETLADEAESLKRRLRAFREEHGSEAAQVFDPRAHIQDNVDPTLMDAERELDDLPIDDCLRTSIYETLMSLKQLEPSGEPGV